MEAFTRALIGTNTRLLSNNKISAINFIFNLFFDSKFDKKLMHGQWLCPREPRFDSSHRQTFIEHLFTVNCVEKTKIKKKRPEMAHFKKIDAFFVDSFGDHLFVRLHVRSMQMSNRNRSCDISNATKETCAERPGSGRIAELWSSIDSNTS